MALLSQSDILTTLAYLLGERSVNATTSAPRSDFIQQTLNETYQAYPWRFATANATLTISSGIATLPTDFDINHKVNITWITGTTETRLDEIDPNNKASVVDGNNASWITSIGTDRFTLNTKDTTPTLAIVRYQTVAPTLDSASLIKTPYPNKMTIALGARRWVKLGQNPDSDISQDQKIFENKLAADVAYHQVPAPRQRRRTAQSQTGNRTGDF